MVDDCGREVLFQNRQELRTDTRTLADRIKICKILAPVLAKPPKKITQIFPASSQKRADKRSQSRMDARKSRGSRSTEQSRQHGFRLIVRRVRHGHLCGETLFHDALKERIPEAPCGILHIQ